MGRPVTPPRKQKKKDAKMGWRVVMGWQPDSGMVVRGGRAKNGASRWRRSFFLSILCWLRGEIYYLDHVVDGGLRSAVRPSLGTRSRQQVITFFRGIFWEKMTSRRYFLFFSFFPYRFSLPLFCSTLISGQTVDNPTIRIGKTESQYQAYLIQWPKQGDSLHEVIDRSSTR